MVNNATAFDRDATAKLYAQQHREADPGVVDIFYLPTGSPDREIRLLEVNSLLVERNEGALEPIDFGVDRDYENEHQLLVLDLTPEQWQSVCGQLLALPAGWSLEGKVKL